MIELNNRANPVPGEVKQLSDINANQNKNKTLKTLELKRKRRNCLVVNTVN